MVCDVLLSVLIVEKLVNIFITNEISAMFAHGFVAENISTRESSDNRILGAQFKFALTLENYYSPIRMHIRKYRIMIIQARAFTVKLLLIPKHSSWFRMV